MQNLTTNGTEFLKNYLFSLPNNINIFKNLSDLDRVDSLSVKNQLGEFLSRLQFFLLYQRRKFESLSNLPPLVMIQNNDDQSVLIEWIFKDFRFGFSFEDEASNSYWYFVSNDKFDSISTSGLLKDKNLDSFIIYLLDIIINNV